MATSVFNCQTICSRSRWIFRGMQMKVWWEIFNQSFLERWFPSKRGPELISLSRKVSSVTQNFLSDLLKTLRRQTGESLNWFGEALIFRALLGDFTETWYTEDCFPFYFSDFCFYLVLVFEKMTLQESCNFRHVVRKAKILRCPL